MSLMMAMVGESVTDTVRRRSRKWPIVAVFGAASGAYVLAIVRAAVEVGMLGRPLATGGSKKDRMSNKKGGSGGGKKSRKGK